MYRNFDLFIIIEDISDHFACLSVVRDQNKSIKVLDLLKLET